MVRICSSVALSQHAGPGRQAPPVEDENERMDDEDETPTSRMPATMPAGQFTQTVGMIVRGQQVLFNLFLLPLTAFLPHLPFQ